MRRLTAFAVFVSTVAASLAAAAVHLDRDAASIGVPQLLPQGMLLSAPDMGRAPQGLQPNQAEKPTLVAPRNPPGLCIAGRCPT